MPVLVLSPTTGVADTGDTWRSLLLVVDGDGVPAAPDSITGTITVPAGTTTAATVTTDTTGVYDVTYDLAAAGRHLLKVTVTDSTFGDDVAVFEVEAFDLGGTLPDLAAVKAYLGTTSATDAEITAALSSEAAAQRARCRLPAVYPADLGEALKRRVARNLALRGLPLAVLQGDAEIGGMRLPGSDPEVRRLEAPYRRLVVG